MTGPLTADLAVAYVRELSADVRGVAVLWPGEHTHAEPAALATPAEALAAHLPGGWIRLPEGLAVVARAEDGCALVVAAGPHALAGPTALDAAAALGALSGSSAGPAPREVRAPTPDALARARALLSV